MKRSQIVHQLLWYLTHSYGDIADFPGGAVGQRLSSPETKPTTGEDKGQRLSTKSANNATSNDAKVGKEVSLLNGYKFQI